MMRSRRSANTRRVQFDRLESRRNQSVLAGPVELASVGGMLDITLRAHNSSQVIEVAGSDRSQPGVPTLVDGFMTYQWTVRQGAASNGQASGDGYSSPTLRVNPGDTLRIHLENDLVGWSGQAEPTNLHTHGLDFTPLGNSDNVLLSIPAGSANDFAYQIPADQNGAFWYHPHEHGDVSEQVYRGLAGMLIVGRADSGVEQVRDLPTRIMNLQVQRIEISPATGRPTLMPLQTGNFDNTQYTINGQYMPEIRMTDPYEVWVTLALDPRDLTRTFIPPTNDINTWDFESPANQDIYYIAQDGSAFPRTVPKTRAAIAPGKRLAEVVASPPPGTDRTFAITAISPIFTEPMPQLTQPLARIVPAPIAGDPAAWRDVALTNPTRTFQDLSNLPVDLSRTLVFSTDQSDPSRPRFMINGRMFPDPPVFQPRAGTVEEWTIVNTDSIPHPLHIHLQHFQAEVRTGSYIAPDGKSYLYDSRPPHLFDQDVFYVEPNEATVVRIRWADDVLGEAVVHCHNLFHEDDGMMALINVIPNDPQIAAAPATSGPAARFFRLGPDGLPSGQPAASVEPFGPGYRGGINVAMGDVNGDGVPDAMFAGRGPGRSGRVVVRDGADGYRTTLMDFLVDGGARAGRSRGAVSPPNIAAGDINGDSYADIIVSGGKGTRPFVRAYSGRPTASGGPGELLADFAPFDAPFRGGVNVAAADVDGSGRIRIVTTPGPGHRPVVRVWGWDLYRPIGGDPRTTARLGAPALVDEFLAGPARDRRGLDVVTSNFDAVAGGFSRIATSPATRSGVVTVWKSRGGMAHDMGMSVDPMPMSQSMNTDMGMDKHGEMPMGPGAERRPGQVLASFRPLGRKASRDGFALGSINTPTGSLLVVGSRGMARKGKAGPLAFFAPGAGGTATRIGSVDPQLRGAVGLGGS